MIISSKAETHDEPWRLVMFNPTDSGKCVPDYIESEYNEEIRIFYQQRAEELERLHREVLTGTLSPVAFFVKYQTMNVKDVAARVKLRSRVVEKHMTLEGFKSARVEELQRYARVFDVSVSDFFDFTFIGDTIAVETKRHHDRLISESTMRVKKDAGRDEEAAHE